MYVYTKEVDTSTNPLLSVELLKHPSGPRKSGERTSISPASCQASLRPIAIRLITVNWPPKVLGELRIKAAIFDLILAYTEQVLAEVEEAGAPFVLRHIPGVKLGGSAVGDAVGFPVGTRLGLREGFPLDEIVGAREGTDEGRIEGCTDGVKLGPVKGT